MLLLSHQTAVMTSQYPSGLRHCILLLYPHTVHLSHWAHSPLSTQFVHHTPRSPRAAGCRCMVPIVTLLSLRRRRVAQLSLRRAGSASASVAPRCTGCCRCACVVRCCRNPEVVVEVMEFAPGDCTKPRRPPSFGVKGSITGIRLDYPLHYSYVLL